MVPAAPQGSEKAELQAKLCFFIDSSVGFYLQGYLPHAPLNSYVASEARLELLQEFCDCYELELPFRTKAINLGILQGPIISECKPVNQLRPKISSCYYISQDCLVHLGDLARYRNDVAQAESYYKLASTIIAVNDIDKIGSLHERMLDDLEALSDDLTSDQLLNMALITIFTLYKSKPKEEDSQEDCIAEDEIEVWNLISSFTASFYTLLVTLASRYQKLDDKEDENKFLPCVKILSDWILCSGSSILMEEAFDRNKELYKSLTLLGNGLLVKATEITSPTALPLPEDREVRGFFPLRRIHRRLQFKHSDKDSINVQSLRAYRIISYINWLCQQEPASRYIAKGESNGNARFFFLQQEDPVNDKHSPKELKTSTNDFDVAVRELFDALPDLQGRTHQARSKSPFRETRSLFRTDSEEQGIKDVPVVSGPVASYSLFDSPWSVPLNRSPTKESSSDEPGYSELFEKLTLDGEASPQPSAFAGSEVEAITTSEMFPKSTRSVNIGVFPSSATSANAQSRHLHAKQRDNRPLPSSPMASQIPNHPIQQQLTRIAMNNPHIAQSSFYGQAVGPNRIPARVEGPVLQQNHVGINNAGIAINQHPLSFVGPVPRVPIAVQQGMSHPGHFPAFVPPVVPNGAVFGAIGQTPRSQYQNNQGHIHQHPPNTINFTPPESPGLSRNSPQGNQSIWSSNFGFGHGAMSPLEQLLSDQKRTQQPPVHRKPTK
eukprot:gene10907-19738_t